MKKSDPHNLFELDMLEERILLSGDPVTGVLAAGAPGGIAPFAGSGSDILPAENITLSAEQTLNNPALPKDLQYTPSENLDDIFAGLQDVTAAGNDGASAKKGATRSAMSVTRRAMGATSTITFHNHSDTVTTGDEIYFDFNIIIGDDVVSDTYGDNAVYLDTTNGGDSNYSDGANIFITGTVNGEIADAESLYLNAGATGDIHIQDDIGTSKALKDIHIVQAKNVYINGILLISNDLIQDGGQGDTIFDKNVTAGRDVNISTTNSITFGNDLKATSGNITLKIDSVNATSGLIAVNNNTQAGGNLSIVEAKNVNFGTSEISAAVAVNGSVTQTTGTGSTIFYGPVSAGSVNLTVDDQVRFANSLTADTGGDITLKSDAIDFEGGANSVSGDANLVLIPTSENVSIDVGSPVSGTGTLDISDTDLAALDNGFSEIRIGYDTGAQHAIVMGSSSFSDPVKIYGGSVTVKDDFSGLVSAEITANSGDITIDTAEFRVDNESISDVYGDASIQFTAAAGDIVLMNNGAITANVNDPSNASQNAAIQLTATAGNVARATGSTGLVTGQDLTVTALGNIDLMTAVDTLVLSSTTSGNIDIVENGAVELTDIDTANGAITVQTGGTTDVIDVESITDAAGNDISIHATAGDIQIHLVDAKTAGDVTLTADAGKITDANGDESAIIIGDAAVFTAESGIGLAVGDGDLDVQLSSSLSATNTGETGDIKVTQLSGALLLDASQSNVVGSGSVEITTASGLLTVASGDVTVQGSGHVSLESTAGIAMAADASVETNGGYIALQAAGDVTLGKLDSRTSSDRSSGTLTNQVGWGSVAVITSSGGITDVNNDGQVNIYAGSLLLSAQNKIGELAVDGSADAIEVEAATIAAATGASGTGSINILESTGVTVGSVTAPGGIGTTLNGLSAGGNGAVVFRTTDGPVNIAEAISANVTGNVLVQTGDGDSSGDSDIIVNASVTGTTGNISLIAASGLNQNTDITTGGGTIDVESTNGSITMSDGTKAGSTGGNMRYKAGQDVQLALLDAGAGEVSVIAGIGVTDADAGAGNDITSSAMRIVSGGNIGTGADHLEITTSTLAAQAGGAGGIFLTNAQAAAVGTVGTVAVNRVQANATVVSEADVAGLSDLTTTNSGDIVLNLTAGDLTITDGITANGDGKILLQSAAGSVAINDVVGSGTGSISVLAATNVAQSADIITTGTIDIEATNGSITMFDGTKAGSTGGNMRYKAGQDVQLALLDAETGEVSVIAGTGVTDADAGAGNDITSSAMRIVSGGNIGTGADHLEITTSTLAAQAGGAGGIFLTNAQAAAVGTVGTVAVNRVQANATVVSEADVAGLSDLTTTNSGDIVLNLTAGDLTITDGITANGDGKILLQSAAGSVAINDVVGSGTGSISALAATNVAQSADIITTGTIDIEATSGSITMSDGTKAGSTGDNIRYKAGQDVQLALLDAGAGEVSVIAGTGVTDADAGAGNDITSLAMRIVSGGNIGTGADHLEITTSTLAAQAGGAGGIFLTNSQAVAVSTVATVSVNRVQLNATTAAEADASVLSDLTTTANGNIVLQTSSGDLTITDGADADGIGVSANGDGNILLQTQWLADSIVLSADVISGSGNISLTAGSSVSQNADINTTGGSIDVEAGQGLIAMSGGTTDSGGGNILYAASAGISITSLSAGAGGNIALTTENGSITENGDADVDIVADGLRLEAGYGIGVSAATFTINSIEITAGTLSAVSGPGGISLAETDALIAGAVDVRVEKVSSDGSTDYNYASLQSGIHASNGGFVDVKNSSGDITVTSTPAVATLFPDTDKEITLVAEQNGADYNGYNVVFEESDSFTGDEATASYDNDTEKLTVTVNSSGETTVGHVVQVINAATDGTNPFPFTARQTSGPVNGALFNISDGEITQYPSENGSDTGVAATLDTLTSGGTDAVAANVTMLVGPDYGIVITADHGGVDTNGVLVRILDDGSGGHGEDAADVVYDSAGKKFSIYINNGVTTTGTVVDAVNNSGTPFIASLVGIADGTETIHTAPVTTVSQVSATVNVRPPGGNNDILLTANTVGTGLNGVTVKFVDDGSVSGNSAGVEYNTSTKILTVKIVNGVTDAKAVITAINNQGLFTASLDMSQETDNTGLGQLQAHVTVPSDHGDGTYAILQPAGSDNNIKIVPWAQIYNSVQIRLESGDTFTVGYNYTTKILTITVKNEMPFTNAQAVIDAVNDGTIPFDASVYGDGEGISGIEAFDEPVTGGGIGNTAQAVMDPDGGSNEIRFTAETAGSDYAGVKIRLVDDGTITDGSAQADYDSTNKLLIINLQNGVTTAATILDAVNNTAGVPFMAENVTGSDGSGTIHTPAAETSGGFDAVYAGIKVEPAGANNDFTVTGTDSDAGASGVELVLIHDGSMGTNAVVSYDNADSLHRRLTIKVKNGITTANNIIAAFGGGIPFTAVTSEGDGNGIITTGAVSHPDSGTGAVVINTAGDLYVKGAITSAIGVADIDAGENIFFSGADGKMEAGGTMDVNTAKSIANTASTAQTTINGTGQKTVTLTSGNRVTASTENMVIDSRGGLTLKGAGLAFNGGNLAAGADDLLSIEGQIYASSDSVALNSEDDISIKAPVTASNMVFVAGTEGSGSLTINAALHGGTVNIQAADNVVQKDNITVTGDATVIVNGLAGSVTMDDGMFTVSGTGDISYQAGADIALSRLESSSGNLNVTAGGAITDNTALENANLQTGSSAVIFAADGIGSTGVADIDTEVDNVDAKNSGNTGNIVIEETATGGDITIVRLAQTGENSTGHIIVSTLDGTMTLAAGESGVRTAGSGSILLQAGDDDAIIESDLVINEAISSQSGNISLIGAGSVSQQADVSTTGGDILVQASSGNITMADITNASSSGGDIQYQAGADITVSLVNAGNGNVSLISSGGSVFDNGEKDQADVDKNDVIASGFIATAANRVGEPGTGGTALDTSVDTVSALSGAGGIFLAEADAVAVDNVSVSVNRLNINGTLTPLVTGQSDLVSGSGGSIVLTTIDGSIIINGGGDNIGVTAGGTGNILLNAGDDDATAGSDLTLQAGVISGAGSISLLAARNMDQQADVTTTGTVDVEASSGTATMGDGTTTGGNTIRYRASGDLTVGLLNSGTGSVSLISDNGSIKDNGDSTGGADLVDVIAGNLRMNAAIGIGEIPGSGGGEALETTVATLRASSGAGGIYIAQTGDVTVDTVEVALARVKTDGTVLVTPDIVDAAQSDLTTTGGGNIVLSAGGHLVLNDGDSDGLAVSAETVGQIALGAGDVTIKSQVKSSAGSITVTALTGDIIQDVVDPGGGGEITYGHLSTTNAEINVLAPQGNITMKNGVTTTSGGAGDVAYTALENILVGGIDAGTGNLKLTAGDANHTGSILDNGDLSLDLKGVNLTAIATGSVGVLGASANGLETDVDTATITAGGDISLEETDDITVKDISTTAGSVVIITKDGAINVEDGNADGIGVNVAGAGNTLLQAGNDDQFTNSESVVLKASVSSGTGNISIIASNGDVLQNIITNASDVVISAGNILVAGGTGTIDVQATGGSIIMEDGAGASTVNSGIRYKAEQDISVGNISAGTGSVSLIAETGNISDADSGSGNNIAALMLRMTAGQNVGEESDPMETAVTEIAVRAEGSGGIFITNSQTMNVTGVQVTVLRVQEDGSANIPDDQVIDVALSDLATLTNGGDINVNISSGDLEVTAGSDGDDIGISADGDGNIFLQTGTGAVEIDGDIKSVSGDISILSKQNITIKSGRSISTAGQGAVNMAVAGNGIMETGSAIVSGGSGSIRFLADGDIVTGSTDSGDGDTHIVSLTGGITDNADNDSRISAAGLRLQAATGAGEILTGNGALEIDASILSVMVENGNVSLAEQDEVIVDSVSAVFPAQGGDISPELAGSIQSLLNMDGATVTELSNPQSDLLTSSGGSIQLMTGDQKVTFKDGDGNGYSVSAAGGIVINNPGAVRVESGFVAAAGVSFTGAGNIELGDDIRVTGSGGAVVVPDSMIVLTGDVTIETSDGNITLDEIATDQDNMHVLTLSAGSGTVLIDDNVGTSETEVGGLTVTGAGDVQFSGAGATVNLAGNLDINTGTLTMDGSVTTTNNGLITVTNSGAANLNGDITSAGNITFDGAGPINLGADIETTGVSGEVEYSGNILTIYINNGVTTANSVIGALSGSGFTASWDSANESGNDGTGVLPENIASVVTQGGDADNKAAASVQPDGDNNDLVITAIDEGDIYNGLMIQFVDDGSLSGDNAQAVYAYNPVLGATVSIPDSTLILTGGDHGITTSDGDISLDEIASETDGSHVLTLTAGTGNVVVDDMVGPAGARPGGITVVSARDLKFEALVNVAGNVDLNSRTLTLNGDLATTGAGTVTVTNTDTANLNGNIISAGNLVFDGAGTIHLAGNMVTTDAGSAVTVLESILTLTGGDRTITANNGNITLDEISTDTDGSHVLTLTAGTGDIIVDDNIGVNGGPILGGLIVASGHNILFSGADATIDASLLTIGQVIPVADVQFDAVLNISGPVDINTGTMTLNAALNTTGGGTVTLTNTAEAAINGKITSEGAVHFDGTGGISLNAGIETTGESAPVTVDTSAITLKGDQSIAANNGDIILDEILTDTDADHVLTITAGTGNVLIDDNTGVNGGDITGGLVIGSAALVHFSGADATIDTGLLTVGNVTPVSNVIFDGAVNVTGKVDIHTVSMTLNNNLTTTGGDIILTGDGTGALLLAGDIKTQGAENQISISGLTMTLAGGDRAIITNNGNVTLDKIATDTAGAHVLTLTTGTGDIVFNGIVGSDIQQLGGLVINSAADVLIMPDAITVVNGDVIVNAAEDIMVQAPIKSYASQDSINLQAGSDGQGSLIIEQGGGISAFGAAGEVHLAAGNNNGDIVLAGDIFATVLAQLNAPSGTIEQSAGTITAATVTLNAAGAIHGIETQTLLNAAALNINAQSTEPGDIMLLDTAVQGQVVNLAGLKTPGGDIVFLQNFTDNGSGLTGSLNITGEVDASSIENITGDITILSNQDIVQTAAGKIKTSGGGIVTVGAGTAIDMQAGSSTEALGTGAVRYLAFKDITAGSINADTGNAILTSFTESVLDNGDGNHSIAAAGLLLNAVAGIGESGSNDALPIDAQTLSARAGSGGIHLSELNDVVITSVGPIFDSTEPLIANLTTLVGTGEAELAILYASQADLVTLNGGNIVLSSGGTAGFEDGDTNGFSVLSSGGFELNNTGTATINSDLSAVTGATFSGTGDVFAGADITVTAAGGGISSADSEFVLTKDVLLTTNDGSVSLDAVRTDNPGEHVLNVVAGNGDVTFDDNMGVSGVEPGKLMVESAGNVRFLTGDATVDVENLTINATGQVRFDAPVTVGTEGGSAVIIAENGPIMLNPGGGITIKSTGHLILKAENALSNIDIQAPIKLNAGSVSVLAGNNIAMGATGSITVTGSGTIDLEAENGSIAIADSGAVSAQNGNIRLWAYENITLTGVHTNKDVSITAHTGSILDGGSDIEDIAGENLRLEAATGIGLPGNLTANALEINADNLAALAGSQGINLYETDGLNITFVSPVTVNRVESDASLNTVGDDTFLSGLKTKDSGSLILVGQTGEIRVRRAVVADGSGNILIKTQGESSDIILEKQVVSGTGNISIIAGGSFYQSATVEEGGTTALTGSTLQYIDNDNTASELAYVLTQLPAHGVLMLNGLTLTEGDEFTQDDLNNELLVYVHDGSETVNDGFGYDLEDGKGGVVQGNYEIAIDPVNDAPVNTVPATSGQDRLDTNTGQDIVFTGDNAIFIQDSDSGVNPVTVKLEITPSIDGAAVLSVTPDDNVDVIGNRTGLVTLTGIVDDINSVLSTLIYSITDQASAFTDTLVVKTFDNGYSGKGGSLTDTDHVFIKVNQVPELTDNESLAVNEGQSAGITDGHLLVADGDNLAEDLIYTITSGPVFGFVKINGVAVSSFTQAQINAGFVTYTHDGSENFTDGFNFTVSDGDGGSIGETAFSILVTPVNDAPVINVPGAQFVNEGGSLSLEGISISDADSGSDDITINFSITGNAALNASGFSNLTITGNGSADLTLTGAVNDINTWLETSGGLVFTPAQGSGYFSDTLTITVNDGQPENNISTENVSIKVNDVPGLVNVGMTVTEGAEHTITSGDLLVNDADNTPADLTYTLISAPFNGVIKINGEAVTTFTQEDVNGGLVSYTHDGSETGSDNFIFSLSDGDGGTVGSTSFNITVVPVNDLPEISVSKSQSLNINSGDTLSFNGGIVVKDDDSGTGSITISFTVDHGSLSIDETGISVINGNGTGQLTVTDTLTKVNDALNTLVYTPDAGYFTDSLSMTVSDGVDQTDDSVSIKVNDIPVLTDHSLTVDEGGGKAVDAGDLLATDQDNTDEELTYTLISVPEHGVLSIGGETAGVSANFTQADIAAGLVSYTHDGGETITDSFNFSLSDGDGGTIDNAVMSIDVIPVNDIPQASLPENQVTHTNAGQNLSFSNGILIVDDDAPADTFSVSLSVGSGYLSIDISQLPPGVSVTGNTTQLVVIEGSVPNINSVLQTLVYFPGSGSYTATLSVTMNDGNAVAVKPINIKVNNVPVVNTSLITVDEGAAATVSNLYLDVIDSDNDSSDIVFTLTGIPANGFLTLNGEDIDANASFTMNDINQGLVKYTHDGSETTQDGFTFTVSDGDGGNAGPVVFTIDILPVNDSPVNSLPGETLNTNQGVPLSITGISISDIESENTGAENVTVSLSLAAPASERAYLQITTAGSVQVTGNSSALINLEGSITDINDTLGTLVYVPVSAASPNYFTDTLTITTTDGGNSGAGGIKTDTDSIDVRVNAVPVIETKISTKYISTTAGSIDVEATAGSLNMADGTLTASGGGDIRYFAGSDLIISGIDAGTGSVSLTAEAGSIYDAGDRNYDVAAGSLMLSAGTGIGDMGDINDPLNPSDPLETMVDVIAASSGAGGINLSEADQLEIGTVDVSINRVGDDGETTTINEQITGYTATVGGSIIQKTINGDIILSKPVNTGNAADSNITLISSGSIHGLTGSEGKILGENLNLVSAGSVGELLNPLKTDAGILTISAGTGDISIIDDNTLQIGSLGVTVAGDGSIVLRTQDGSMVVSGLVKTNGTGNILLQTQSRGANANMWQYGQIMAVSGNISLISAGGIAQNSNIQAAGGTIDVMADGAISMADKTLTKSENTNIRYYAVDDITISGIKAGTGSVSITSTAGSILDGGDWYVDVKARELRMVVAEGIGSKDGETNPLETEVALIAASAGNGGIHIAELDDIEIGTVGPVEFNRVNPDGTITLITDDALAGYATSDGGSIILTTDSGVITVTDSVTVSGDGNVLLQSPSGDVQVNSTITSENGNVAVLSETPGTFNWNPVAGSTIYFVSLERNGAVFDSDWVDGSTQWSPGYVLPAGYYVLTVRPWTSAGFGEAAVPITFTVTDLSSPETPVYTNEEKITIQWNGEQDARWYHIVIKQEEQIYDSRWVENTISLTLDYTLAAGNYTWTVQSWGSGGLGAVSEDKTFIVKNVHDIQTETPPSGVQVYYTDNVKLQWPVVQEARWYHLDIQKDNQVYFSQWVEDTTQWFPDFTMNWGEYQWTIQSWGVNGLGDESDPLSFFIQRNP